MHHNICEKGLTATLTQIELVRRPQTGNLSQSGSQYVTHFQSSPRHSFRGSREPPLPLMRFSSEVHIGRGQVLIVGGEPSDNQQQQHHHQQQQQQQQQGQSFNRSCTNVLQLDLQDRQWDFAQTYISNSNESEVIMDRLSKVQLTSLVHDPATQKIYCMFGWTEDEYINDVYVLEPSNYGRSCRDLGMESLINQKAAEYLIRRLDTNRSTANYVRSYTDVQTVPEQPSPKFGQTATLIKNCRSQAFNGIYVFGGYGHGVFFNDLWILNIETKKWSLVHRCADNPNQTTRASRLFKFRPLDTMDPTEDQESAAADRNSVHIPGFGDIPDRKSVV